MRKHLLTPLLIGMIYTVSVQADTALETDKDQLSYSLGVLIGERVLKKYQDVNYEVLLQGLKAQHSGNNALMSVQQAGQVLDSISQKIAAQQSAAVIAKGEQYLKENASKDGVQVTASGLQYSVIKSGNGKKPKASDKVTVHYRGTLLDGTEFDSSYSRGQPATFMLNQVIKGWTEGVQLMNEGSKFKFVIPSQLAYGARGTGSSIGPHETLIFDVELISIN